MCRSAGGERSHEGETLTALAAKVRGFRRDAGALLADPAIAPGVFADAYAYSAPVVDVPVHLAWLEARVRAAGGVLVAVRSGGARARALRATPARACGAQRTLSSLSGVLGVVAPRVPAAVVHASGIGARELVGDRSVAG